MNDLGLMNHRDFGYDDRSEIGLTISAWKCKFTNCPEIEIR